MIKDDTYYLHQTPAELAKDLICQLPIDAFDVLYEPFRGEGAFYNNFPAQNTKQWSEIMEGRDYITHSEEYDWVISNPPFRIEHKGKRVNSFWQLLDYYSIRAKKGIAFLGNDRCFSTLTPKRLQMLKDRGWSFYKITTCNIKKWRGRYYFVVLTKINNDFYNHLSKSY